MSEPQITISKDWKTKERLQLIEKAAQWLLEVGVMAKSQYVSIHNAVYDAKLESVNRPDHRVHIDSHHLPFRCRY